MNHICPIFFTHYIETLRTQLKQRISLPKEARAIADAATAAGLTTLNLARLHEHILLTEILVHVPARQKPAIINRAAAFFASIIASEITCPNEQVITKNHKKIIFQLSQHVHELAVSKLKLRNEIARHKATEKSLRESETHYIATLKETRFLKEQLHRMARKILTTQEEERKKISRDLHDVIAQSLMSINVKLATLKKQTGLNVKDFNKAITGTQSILAKTAGAVHRFASGLRPPVLDDMGLIPALHAFLLDFTIRSGVKAEIIASRAVEKIRGDALTVLFRVAQEAITNIERHADATSAKVCIKETSNKLIMSIIDDGKSFNADKFLRSRTSKLGLLGMRERLDMVGGSLSIESSSGIGTTITATIPHIKNAKAIPKGTKK